MRFRWTPHLHLLLIVKMISTVTVITHVTPMWVLMETCPDLLAGCTARQHSLSRMGKCDRSVRSVRIFNLPIVGLNRKPTEALLLCNVEARCCEQLGSCGVLAPK